MIKMTKCVIVSLPIKKGKIDTLQPIYVQRMPRTIWQHSKNYAKGLPRPLSIVTVRKINSSVEKPLVVVGVLRRPSRQDLNAAHPIIRYTGESVTGQIKKDAVHYMHTHHWSFSNFSHRSGTKSPRNPRGHKPFKHHRKRHSKHELKQFHENYRIYRKLPYTMVVAGWHVGFKDIGHGKKRPYINTTKEYNFKVDIKTLNIAQARVHRLAKVITAKGHRRIVINRIIKAKGSIVRKHAQFLEPVQMFLNHGIRNKWIRKIYTNKLKSQK